MEYPQAGTFAVNTTVTRRLRFGFKVSIGDDEILRHRVGEIEIDRSDRHFLPVVREGIEYDDGQPRRPRAIRCTGKETKVVAQESFGDLSALGKAVKHLLVHRIDPASVDVVMGMVQQEPMPRGGKKMPGAVHWVRPDHPGYCIERLRVLLQEILAGVIQLLQGDPRGINALEHFGITAPAELAAIVGEGDAGLLDGPHMIGQGAVLDRHAGERSACRFEECGHVRLGFLVVYPVHQERASGAAERLKRVECLSHMGKAQLLVELHLRRVAPPQNEAQIGEIVISPRHECGQHRGAVQCFPVELGAKTVRLLADSTPEKGVVDSETSQDLGQLRDVAKTVRDVADARASSQILGHTLTEEEIANQGFGAYQKLVRKDEPGSDGEAAVSYEAHKAALLVGTDLEIVLEDRELAVEHEDGKGAIFFQKLN